MKSFQSLTINTDGGSRGNPGPSAIGVVCLSDTEQVFQLSEYIGITTNNVAEYTAVLKSLEYLIANEISASNVSFFLDSELIVKQLQGLYKIKQPHLQELNSLVKQKIEILKNKNSLREISFTHVLREKNKEADHLVNLSLDSQ